jgi:hypothetical protein
MMVLCTGMNVVMPTATSSMHTDPALSAASQKTAERGLKVLKSLLKESDAAKDHCKAIYSAAVAELKENEHHANTLDRFDAERVKVRIRTKQYVLQPRE